MALFAYTDFEHTGYDNLFVLPDDNFLQHILLSISTRIYLECFPSTSTHPQLPLLFRTQA
jgi:hypothetical protein